MPQLNEVEKSYSLNRPLRVTCFVIMVGYIAYRITQSGIQSSNYGGIDFIIPGYELFIPVSVVLILVLVGLIFLFLYEFLRKIPEGSFRNPFFINPKLMVIGTSTILAYLGFFLFEYLLHKSGTDGFYNMVFAGNVFSLPVVLVIVLISICVTYLVLIEFLGSFDRAMESKSDKLDKE